MRAFNKVYSGGESTRFWGAIDKIREKHEIDGGRLERLGYALQSLEACVLETLNAKQELHLGKRTR